MSRKNDYLEASQHTTAGPYSPLLRIPAGDIVVVSGQGPLDDSGAVIGGDIRAQTRLTLANCSRQLAVAGATLDDVFKVTAFLADLDEWDEFNAEYLEHFAHPLPVRTTVGVRLLLGMKVEIDVWAAP